MKVEIKSRWHSQILFSVEANSLKAALEIAIQKKAYLRGADLRGAYLRGAYLRGAYLTGADLTGAYLRGAYLTGAYLRGAYLTGADLTGADLRGAYLRGAYLRGTKGINKYRVTPLLFLKDQPGKIHAYKLINRKGEGPFNGGIQYEIGTVAEVEAWEEDETIQCAAGISLATLDWCMNEWQQGCRILIAEFTADDIVAIPIATDGKFRVKRCKIVGEKDLEQIGLIEKENGNSRSQTQA
jgi:uncharacterized protein YjbI with pentapeptide repeats